MSRSKRLTRVANAALTFLGHLKVATQRQRSRLSSRRSSCSWYRMYSRITVSSRPTVETQYPRAPKCCPTKCCLRSPYTRTQCIARLPLRNPITCGTAYLGGIAISLGTGSSSRCPSSIRRSFCPASLRNTSPQWFLNCRYNVLRRHFGINTTWYLHSHLLWLRVYTKTNLLF